MELNKKELYLTPEAEVFEVKSEGGSCAKPCVKNCKEVCTFVC